MPKGCLTEEEIRIRREKLYAAKEAVKDAVRDFTGYSRKEIIDAALADLNLEG